MILTIPYAPMTANATESQKNRITYHTFPAPPFKVLRRYENISYTFARALGPVFHRKHVAQTEPSHSEPRAR